MSAMSELHFVLEDGSIVSMGLNADGQLGHSASIDAVTVRSQSCSLLSCACSRPRPEAAQRIVSSIPLQDPREALLPEPIAATAAGHHHTLCLSESGTVWCMGANTFGQLGIGREFARSSLPRLVRALSGADLLLSPRCSLEVGDSSSDSAYAPLQRDSLHVSTHHVEHGRASLLYLYAFPVAQLCCHFCHLTLCATGLNRALQALAHLICIRLPDIC